MSTVRQRIKQRRAEAEERGYWADFWSQFTIAEIIDHLGWWHNVEMNRLARHEIKRRLGKAFRAEHGLSIKEFQSEHWQTLFAIQYPETRA